MVARRKIELSPEDYLALESEAETKNEYRRGDVVAMTGASWNHSQIVVNLIMELGQSLKDGPCTPTSSDVRLWLSASERFTYPDVMVVCGGPEFAFNRRDTITNPRLIIEVLSKSTAEYDRTEKFHASWKLASLQEYVLIDQYRPRMEVFRQKDEGAWDLRVQTKLTQSVYFESVDLSLELSEIYRGVVFPESSELSEPDEAAAGEAEE